MSIEDYLKQNIKPEILQQATEFQKSSKFKSIQAYSKSEKYQAAKMELKTRDKVIHKSTLSDIQRLQDRILVG